MQFLVDLKSTFPRRSLHDIHVINKIGEHVTLQQRNFAGKNAGEILVIVN